MGEISDVCIGFFSRTCKTCWPIFFGALFLVLYNLQTQTIIRCVPQIIQSRHVDICSRGDDDLQRVILQRNRLATLLNDITQRHAQLHCQNNKDKVRLTAAETRLCEGTGELELDSPSQVTDPKLALAIASLFGNKTVVSFGDGPGLYKKYIAGSGKVLTYEAFNDAPYPQKLSGRGVKYIKLTIPQFGLGLYDWVLCLDVADTIPRQQETVFVDNLVRHAMEGVVLSWVPPSHDSGSPASVNKRKWEFVNDIFAKLGFVYDSQSSTTLQRSAVLPWLRKGTYVFRRLPSILPCLIDI